MVTGRAEHPINNEKAITLSMKGQQDEVSLVPSILNNKLILKISLTKIYKNILSGIRFLI